MAKAWSGATPSSIAASLWWTVRAPGPRPLAPLRLGRGHGDAAASGSRIWKPGPRADGALQGDAHIGDGQRVLDEGTAGEIVLARPVDGGDVRAVMLDQQLGAAIGERVDHRRRAAVLAIGLELGPRPIEIAGMKEGGQPIAHLLVRRLDEFRQMRRAQEPVLGDEADERDVALGELERLRRLAHEAALAMVKLKSWCNDICHSRSIAMIGISIYKQKQNF